MLQLSRLNSPFTRMYFYNKASENGIFIQDKSQTFSDSAVFIVNRSSENKAILVFDDLLKQTIEASLEYDETAQMLYLQKSSFNQLSGTGLPGDIGDAPLANATCSDADVFCGSGVYGYNAGTNTGSAQSGPAYGCLSSQPNPAWFFLQIGPPGGNVTITISTSPAEDIDFICWGPFTSPTGACESGLTASTIVDCSYSGASTEICDIPGAVVGQFYLLMITNFSNDPTEITFSQTNYGAPGSATTNCDIVINCSLLAITATSTSCNAATNTYSVSGNIEFTNPPATGTLTVTDLTAFPNVTQTFSAPFNSPQPYTLAGITCDGTLHSIKAVFSANDACALTTTYNAATEICPIATISGGGAICDNGTSTANVNINITGVGPFDFTWARNGIPQTPVAGYNGPLPYVITTSTPGAYSLVSVSNFACPGTTSGGATVTLNPLPVPTISGPNSICVGSNGVTYTTEAGKQNYTWTVSAGGTITAGATTNSITVNWTTVGAETITVSYLDAAPTNCAPVTPTVYNVTVVPTPVANAGTEPTICQGQPASIADASVANEASYSWAVVTGLGTLTGGGTLTPTYTPTAAETGDVVLSLTASGLSTCSAVSSQVIIHIIPKVTATAGPDNAVCQNSGYKIITASASQFSSLLWTSTGTGTLIDETTISPTYQPGVGETGPVTLTLTANGNSPCSPVIDDMLLTVHPLPTVNAGGPVNSICQGNNFNVAGATSNFTSSLTWTENGPGSLVNPNTLTPTYVPVPGETGTLLLTLTAQGSNTCSTVVVSGTRTLTINPLPTVDAGPDATICAANTYTLSGIQQYTSALQWTTAGDGTFSVPGSLTAVYTPGANDIAAGSVLLTLTGTGSGSCTSVNAVDQLLLTINPMPAVNAGPDGAFCVQSPIALTGTTASNYTSLQWITSGDGNYNTTTILSPTYMPGNIDLNNGTVTLTLKATGRLACASKNVTDTRVLSVSGYPVVNAGPDDYICSNVTQYQLVGIGNYYNTTNIQWTFSGGDGFLSNPNIINPIYFAGPNDLNTFNRNITFTLTLQGTGNCSGIFVLDQVVLKIDPTPVSNAGPDGEICGRNPFQLSASAQFQSIITWTTSGDGTFTNPNILNPKYTPGPTDVGNIVVLTLGLAGCKTTTGNDFLWLTVHPDPGAVISGTTGICEGTSTPVSIALTGSPPWSVTYTNGITPVTVNNIMSSPYTFNVSPMVSTNWWVTAASDSYCPAPAASLSGLASVTVFPLPFKYTATVTNNGVFCQGTPGVTIGLNGSQLGMNYELRLNGLLTGTIRPGTGSPLNFGIVNVPGQYSIRGINPAGNCEMMMNDTLTVIMNPIPVTDFTSSIPCFGDTTTFNVSGAYINSTSYWNWNFGDGNFATYNAPFNPKHYYAAPGTYNVSLSVGDTNSCQYSVTHPVVVRAHPVAFFSYNTPNCIATPVALTDLSSNTGNQGYLTQWVWNFGDGSPLVTIDFPNSPNVIHNYPNEGTYVITLTVMNSKGCGDTYSTSITVTKRPVAIFDFTTGCQEETTQFSDFSNPNGGGQITAWSWNFGDAASGINNISTLKNPVHNYASSGLYNVRLIVTNQNGCKDTLQKSVNVKTRPDAEFFSSAGCMNSPTQFLADSTVINIAATSSYLWNFGDGATSANRNTSHTYIAPGTYTVTLTITDTAGCVGSISHPLTVNPPPTAQFSATTDNCLSQSVAFLNQSTTVTGYVNQWILEFWRWQYPDHHFPGITQYQPFLFCTWHIQCFTYSHQ